MRIYCLFRREPACPNDMPWLVDAVDEYTIDEAGMPEGYMHQSKEPNTRELVVVIPDKSVEDLFEAPEVKGRVVDS